QLVLNPRELIIIADNNPVTGERVGEIIEPKLRVPNLELRNRLVLTALKPVEGGFKVKLGFGDFVLEPKAPSAIQMGLSDKGARRRVGDQPVKLSQGHLQEI